MMKILATGDWHIGRYNGPEKDGENARYLDICDRLDELVEDAKAAEPDYILVSGDIFHAARTWSDRGLQEVEEAVKIIRELSRIADVIVMRGTPNHDGARHFDMLKTAFAADSMITDSRVRIVTEPELLTYEKDGEKVQVACVPGFERGYYRAKHPGLAKEDENAVFTEAVKNLIVGLKAQCDADAKTILMSHYTIAGCNMESGQTAAFFAQFEPIVYPDTLQAADFDLVCFGHIHRPQQTEGSRNTFYCGALAQLNFNDEGQERGYWMHEIDGAEVRSEFKKLHGREFYTIRMYDDAVADFVADPTAIPDAIKESAKDKIVRVLYDCTDEHNKAFNHALYEKELYEAGAFFVQEITPQKISITVNKAGLEAEDSPEDNLAAYLTEKEISPERIGELVEMARPIIAEATEKATVEHETGMFVPEEIEVKNYRNYRDETFSFRDISFCTINGENGVGKSSLFMDAMADALYEQPREGELTGWIRNAEDAKSGSIKFTFRLGEKTYRVTRTRQKSGHPTLNLAELVDGEWEDRSKEKIVDTQAELINTIGMDSMTFKACALIMQDQYGIFLQADKEARMNILGNILGLGVYGDMEDMAAEKLTDTKREIRLNEEQEKTLMADIPDAAELDARIEDAAARMKALKDQGTEKEKAIDSLKVALNTRKEAEERAMKLNGRIATLAANKAMKESNKSAQVAIIVAADVALGEEDRIREGIAEHDRLVEEERGLVGAKATYDSFEAKMKEAEERMNKAKAAMEETERRIAESTAKKAELNAVLAKAAELEEKHRKYEEVTAKVADMEALEPGYLEKEKALQTAKDEAKRIQNEYETEKAKLTQQITALKAKVELLSNSGCPDVEKANCRFLKDALEAKESLPQIEAKMEQVEADYKNASQNASEALRTARNNLDGDLYSRETLTALRSDWRLLGLAENEYNALGGKRAERDAAEEKLKDLEDQRAKQAAELADTSTAYGEAQAALEQYADINTKITEIQAKIGAAKVWIEKEKALPVQREKKAAAAERVSELDGEIIQIDRDIEDAKVELEKEKAASAGSDEIRAQVESAEAEIRDIELKAAEAAKEIGALERDKADAEERLNKVKQLQKEINALGEKAAGYDILKAAFSQDGIPHNIIRSIIPVFEATATNILGQMSGGKMSVEIALEKTLKSDKKREKTTLDVIINDINTGRLPYLSRSGGEKVKASLAVILALSEIKSGKAGIQLGFLSLDEPPFLDESGTQAYVDALEAIQRRYPDKKIIAITHDNAFKARFPQSVTVYKDEDSSHIRNN